MLQFLHFSVIHYSVFSVHQSIFIHLFAHPPVNVYINLPLSRSSSLKLNPKLELLYLKIYKYLSLINIKIYKSLSNNTKVFFKVYANFAFIHHILRNDHITFQIDNLNFSSLFHFLFLSFLYLYT